MEQTIIYALDFDGVICDSADETGIAGWKAALNFWADMHASLPAADMLDQFRQIRPAIETGYEAVLVMRLLFEGNGVEHILQHFSSAIQQIAAKYQLDIEQLKQVFGDTRDHWINHSAEEWRSMNPLFPGVTEKLRRLSGRGTWYVVTTKQERFVAEILNYHQIQIPSQHIYGLDRKMSKAETLLKLQHRHPGQPIVFVEDRLAALLSVMTDRRLSGIKLFLADWGYNTDEDRRKSRQHPISLIALDEFLV